MRSNFYFTTFYFTFILLLGFLSCSKENNEVVKEENFAVTLRSNSIPLGSSGSVSFEDIVCLGNESVFTFNFSGNRNIIIHERINGQWVQIHHSQGLKPSPYIWENVFDSGNHELRFRITGPGGGSAIGNVEVTTFEGIEFTGVAGQNSCGLSRSATYTVSSEEGGSYRVSGIIGNGIILNTISVSGAQSAGWNLLGGGPNAPVLFQITHTLSPCSVLNFTITWNVSSNNNNPNITGNWFLSDATNNTQIATLPGLVCVQ